MVPVTFTAWNVVVSFRLLPDNYINDLVTPKYLISYKAISIPEGSFSCRVNVPENTSYNYHPINSH